MLADGLTKISSRQDLADILKKGYHALKFDGEVKAGKKVTAQERRLHQKELDEYANQKKKPRSSPWVGTKATAAAWFAEVVEGVLVAKASCTAVSFPRGDHMWTLVKTVILGILIGMTLMAYCFWHCGCRRKPTTATMSTQAPVRYAWHNATPRFVPLPELMHGGWRE